MANQTLHWKIDLTRAELSFGRLFPMTGNTYDLSVAGGTAGSTYTFYVMAEDGHTCLAMSEIATGATVPTIAFNTEALRNRFDGNWHEIRSFHTVCSDGTSTVAEGDLPIVWNPVWTDVRTGTAATMKGDKGDKGDAATIAVGLVTTGAAGSSASVTNVGSTSAAVFDFTLPKGDKGDTGNAGPANTLAIGTVTRGDTAAATITGTSPNQTLNLTLPKGDKGDDGDAGPANTLSIGTVTRGDTAAATITGTSPDQTLNLTLPKGDKGDDGNAATVSVGTVTTGAAGSSASVTNSGTSSAAVLNFVIPKGDQGDTGTAATIAVGTTTTGAAGSSASVTNVGTSSAAVFNFVIPKGDSGRNGAAATIRVGTVTTGAAGSAATVTNSGTTSAAVFDFAIPRGPKGDQGERGERGFSGVYIGPDPIPEGCNVQIDVNGSCDYDPITRTDDMTQPVGKDSQGRLWTTASSSIASYPSRADFPETGSQGVIYIALDTNISYTWDGTTYVVMFNVLRYLSKSNFPAVGQTGKLYLAMDTSIMYTWTGSEYVPLSQSVIQYSSRSAFPLTGEKNKLYIALDTDQIYHYNTSAATADKYIALGSPSLAPLYSSTETYALGARVIYDGMVWKCTTAIETPEAWNQDHWRKYYVCTDDFQSMTDLTEASTGQQMRQRMNAILNLLKGIVPVLFAMLSFDLFSASVLTNNWDQIQANSPVVTNVTFEGLATTNDLHTVKTNLLEVIAVETNRAYSAETNLLEVIAVETNRAYTAETNLLEMIAVETNRAYTAETNLLEMIHSINVISNKEEESFIYSDRSVVFNTFSQWNPKEVIQGSDYFVKYVIDDQFNSSIRRWEASYYYKPIGGEWIYRGKLYMQGSEARDPNATVLTFPLSTDLTYRTKVKTSTRLATTNDVMAAVTNKQDILVFGTNDEGRVLGVLSNKLAWVDGGSTNVLWGNVIGAITNQTDLYAILTNKQNKLPKVTTGKVGCFLRAKNTSGGLEWATELPSIGSFSNDGKVLMAGVSNKCSWAMLKKIGDDNEWIKNDLTAKIKYEGFTEWYPTTTYDIPIEGQTKYTIIQAFTNGMWMCRKYIYSSDDWVYDSTVNMLGDYENEYATELSFPDITSLTTYRIAETKTKTTKLATTNEVAAKQNALPTAVPGRFLHANDTTGKLEWKDARSSVITNETDGTFIDSTGNAGFATGQLVWNPKEAGSELIKYVVFDEFNELYSAWRCQTYVKNPITGEWDEAITTNMSGDYQNPNATTLTFPDETTTTRRVRKVVQTKLATTNDLASLAGTKVTLNGVDKSGSTASFYAPTSYGSNGQILRCTSGTSEPSWVTPTASLINLGNVVNTGDSATPSSGGTTKFTTGGAYTELAKKVTVDSALKTAWAKSSVWTRRGGAGVTMIYGRVQFNAANSPTGSADDVFSVTVDGTDVNLGTMTATHLGTQDIYVCHVTGGSGTAGYGDWVKLVRSNGATFTGQVKFTPTISGGNGITCVNTDGNFQISSGDNSARIHLRGCTKSSYAGVVDIIAQNTTASKTLQMSPNGTFTFDGKNVAVATSDTTSDWTQLISGNTSIKYRKYNGIVYVWLYGYATTGTAEYSAGTLPAGYRPAFNMPGVFRSLGTTTTLLIIVSPNGVLNVEPGGVSVGTGFYGMLCFPSASN